MRIDPRKEVRKKDQGKIHNSLKIQSKMKTTYNSSGFAKDSGNITSGDNFSIWFASSLEPMSFEKLSRDIDTDVLVVGGGIAGLTSAYCLAKKGLRVILAEDGFIGSGESGRTTAHLTCSLSERYYQLEKTFNPEIAKLAAQSHSAAIEWIANTVHQNNMDCHFKRVDG